MTIVDVLNNDNKNPQSSALEVHVWNYESAKNPKQACYLPHYFPTEQANDVMWF